MSRHTGAFVYTGSGKKHGDDAPIEQKLCKKEACAIQWCLAKRGHKEKYCKDFITAWKACCERAKASVRDPENPGPPPGSGV